MAFGIDTARNILYAAGFALLAIVIVSVDLAIFEMTINYYKEK